MDPLLDQTDAASRPLQVLELVRLMREIVANGCERFASCTGSEAVPHHSGRDADADMQLGLVLDGSGENVGGKGGPDDGVDSEG